jgi:hypothetical protein
MPSWLRAARGEPVDWRRLYAGYRSTVDWPGARFWRDILAAFPAARIILTVRDPEAWYDSTRGTIHAAATEPLSGSGVDPVFAAVRSTAGEVVWDGVFGGGFTDKRKAIRAYEENSRRVIDEVDAGRLLVFEVAEGWKPLCEFLGVPEPDEPFPHVNDRAAFAGMIRERRAAGARR